MKPVLALTRLLFVAAIGLAAQNAFAQAPVQSFTDLYTLVKVGQEVLIWDAEGHKTKARVVSLNGDQLETRQRRWVFLSERRVFREDAVRRIERRDSTWNGQLVGLGVGSLAAFVGCHSSSDPDDWCLAWIGLAPWAGLGVGQAIDAAINRPLYVLPGGRKVTLRPVIGRERAAVAASIRF